LNSLKIKFPIYAILLTIPLCTYSLDSLTLVKKCKGFIKFTELGKYEFNVKSVEDPIINLANESSYCVGYINGFLDSYSLGNVPEVFLSTI